MLRGPAEEEEEEEEPPPEEVHQATTGTGSGEPVSAEGRRCYEEEAEAEVLAGLYVTLV